MTKTLFRLTAAALLFLVPSALAAQDGQGADEGAPVFQITVPPLIEGGPWSGRVIIYLIREDSTIDRRFNPNHGPFFDDPQPMFSMKVEDLHAGDSIMFEDQLWFPVPLKDLPAGRYRAAAVLDCALEHSAWNKEESALESPLRVFDHDPERHPAYVQFPLIEHQVQNIPNLKGVELFETPSALLTQHRGYPVTHRAGVVFPEDYDPQRAYPVVYWIASFATVPEFGGDYRDAWLEVHRRTRAPGPPVHPLWGQAFFIALDTQGQFGHHLVADSENNGPVARAVVEELIPALEAKYRLIAKPQARLLRGHSSGGWSAIWLAMNHPETFGGAWSSAPDPVDFRAFQRVNIYEAENMFVDARGEPVPSYRVDGKVRMTVQQENLMERVLGDRFEGGQQWGSWQAVFGRKSRDGFPRPLFSVETGRIDRAEAEHYRKYDIGHLVRANPGKFGPIFRDDIRIVCGDADNFYLNEAVALLRESLKEIGATGGKGYVELVPDADHGTVMIRANQNAIWDQMLAHLREHGMFR